MTFLYAIGFIYGLITGSFINACAYRIPQDKSLLRRSACPSCDQNIKPYDLIPVLSYFILRGRCRNCMAPISIQYPLVELFTGVCFLLILMKFGMTVETLKYWTFSAILITMAVIDIKTMEIPNKLVVFGIITALFFLTTHDWKVSLVSGIVCFAVMFVIYLISRGGFGEGDVKFSLVIGLYLGWPLSPLSLVISALIGGVVGMFLLATKIKGRKDPVPFGPALAAGALFSMFLGWTTLDWYLGVAK